MTQEVDAARENPRLLHPKLKMYDAKIFFERLAGFDYQGRTRSQHQHMEFAVSEIMILKKPSMLALWKLICLICLEMKQFSP